jgi:serine/threonine protein kinase
MFAACSAQRAPAFEWTPLGPVGHNGRGMTSTRVSELAPGDLVFGERFRIDRHLGSGAMGRVYSAAELPSGRPVALKVMNDEHMADRRIVARFQREGQVMSQLRHPNIVEVFEQGQADGRWFLSMELLRGENLADAISQRKAYEPADAIPVLGAILDALDAAHAQQVVHRDLKPENVFLARRDDGPPTVKVLDFGVAKVVGISAQDQLTRSGTVVGTPEFMSPEQAIGTKVDARSDLYAVGCIAYAMLCGRPPFVDNWPMRVVMKQAFEPHVPPSRARPTLAGGTRVDGFMGRALEKEPAQRYQTAAEMRSALEDLADQTNRLA